MLICRARHAKRSLWILGILIFLSGNSRPAQAAPSEADYLKSLRIAEKKVRLTHPNGSSANPLSARTSALRTALTYRIGDSWDIAALQIDSTGMRMTSDPRHLENPPGRLGIFHYEVSSVHDTLVTFAVRQVAAYGLSWIDPRIETITLSMDPNQHQLQKQYFVRGSARPVSVAPEGLRSGMTLLELFPLDIPEIATAEKSKPEKLPSLPEKLAALARIAGYAPDLEGSNWYEQDDFFGRPVQALWKDGDPWPTYLRTPHGIAIRIKKRQS